MSGDNGSYTASLRVKQAFGPPPKAGWALKILTVALLFSEVWGPPQLQNYLQRDLEGRRKLSYLIDFIGLGGAI